MSLIAKIVSRNPFLFMSPVLSVVALGVTTPSSQVARATESEPQSQFYDSSIRSSLAYRPTEAPLRAGRYGATDQIPKRKSNSSLPETSSIPVTEVNALLRDESLSIGSVTRGKMRGGIPMPLQGDSWHFIPSVQKRATNYATLPLILALQEASRDVQEKTNGPKMLLGNMSYQDGGDIPWSVSHNSGRDADVAFYTVDKNGKPIEHNHFVRYNRRLKSTLHDSTVHFDIPRNWEFVRSLIQSEVIQLQWAFLYNPLRRAILKHAKEIGEPDDLIAKAEKILKQPSDAAPHRDHFHLRIFCSLKSVLQGCKNTGKPWTWANDFQDEYNQHLESLYRQLSAKTELQKAEALQTLNALNTRPPRKPLLRLIRETTLTSTRALAMKLATRYDLIPVESASELLDILVEEPTKIRLISHLAESTDTRIPHILLPHLRSGTRPVRDAVRKALAEVTNHSFPVPPGDEPAHLRLAEEWEKWLETNKDDQWEQWIRQGFEQKGASFAGRMMRYRSIPRLIPFLRRGPHLQLNAHRILKRIATKTAIPKSDSYRSWKKWWKRNYRRYGLKSYRLIAP